MQIKTTKLARDIDTRLSDFRKAASAAAEALKAAQKSETFSAFDQWEIIERFISGDDFPTFAEAVLATVNQEKQPIAPSVYWPDKYL